MEMEEERIEQYLQCLVDFQIQFIKAYVDELLLKKRRNKYDKEHLLLIWKNADVIQKELKGLIKELKTKRR